MKFYCFFEIGEEPEKIKKTLSYLLKDFWQARRPPLESTWNKNLQRWAQDAGLNPYGLSAKTTRKTIESWCVAAGIIESSVCLRQAHDSLTSMRHYQGLAFSEDEMRDIKKQLTSWNLICLLYTSDAADEEDSVDLGG